MSTTIYVVDDDASFLRGVSRLLRAAGLTVSPFESANEFLAEHDPDTPGCLLLDLAMPGLDGLELQEALEARGCRRPIVFLSGQGDVPTTVRAMKQGATDFLTKPVSEEVLLGAISEALDQDRDTRRESRRAADFRRHWAELTPREREVAEHVMAGRLNKWIARDLGIVERTVKLHRSRVMEKLHVRSVADLVRLAERAGFRTGQAPHQS